MYCPKCGGIVPGGASNCPSCGTPVTENFVVQSTPPKSKITAGLFGIFLGCFGAHNFYLGYNKKAIIQLAITLVGSLLFGIGPAVMVIWGIIEGVMYL